MADEITKEYWHTHRHEGRPHEKQLLAGEVIHPGDELIIAPDGLAYPRASSPSNPPIIIEVCRDGIVVWFEKQRHDIEAPGNQMVRYKEEVLTLGLRAAVEFRTNLSKAIAHLEAKDAARREYEAQQRARREAE